MTKREVKLWAVVDRRDRIVRRGIAGAKAVFSRKSDADRHRAGDFRGVERTVRCTVVFDDGKEEKR